MLEQPSFEAFVTKMLEQPSATEATSYYNHIEVLACLANGAHSRSRFNSVLDYIRGSIVSEERSGSYSAEDVVTRVKGMDVTRCGVVFGTMLRPYAGITWGTYLHYPREDSLSIGPLYC